MIQKAYGKDALSKAQVFTWHKAFREGREDVEDEERIGRQSTSHNSHNVAKVKAVLDSDRRLSVRLIADQVGLPKSIVHETVTTELHNYLLSNSDFTAVTKNNDYQSPVQTFWKGALP